MSDPRFLPVELREPIEDSEDELLSEEELYESFLQSKQKYCVKKFGLYVAG